MAQLLEVIVVSLEDALAAEDGGADRLEVVRDLARDGLTPAIDLVETLLARVRLPLRVMVREEEPFVPGTPAVLDAMASGAAALADLPIDGLVVGVLDRTGRVDIAATRRILQAAPSTRVTFHRAFDHAADPDQALTAVQQIDGVDRVLTAGGSGAWSERVARVARWADAAGNRLTMLFAVGLETEGLRMIADLPRAVEVHVGRAARSPHDAQAPVSAAEVRRVRQALYGGH
jgi:copper homeostasis protein